MLASGLRAWPLLRKACPLGPMRGIMKTHHRRVIRAEKALEYGEVIKLVDRLKGAGVSRFGLATDGGK